MFLISRVQSDPLAFLLLGLSLLFFCFWPQLRNGNAKKHCFLYVNYFPSTLQSVAKCHISFVSTISHLFHLDANPIGCTHFGHCPVFTSCFHCGLLPMASRQNATVEKVKLRFLAFLGNLQKWGFICSTIHGPWDEATLTESIHQHNT
jgi:hypothetical protein